MSDHTIFQMFTETVGKFGERPAVGFRKNKKSPISYLSYNELMSQVKSARASLVTLGYKHGDRLAIMFHDNRVEWAIADLAAQSLGIITVPIYGTLPPSQIIFYLNDSGSRGIVLSDNKQLSKLDGLENELLNLKHIINVESSQSEAKFNSIEVISFSEFLSVGNTEEKDLEFLTSAVLPNDVASLIYTSGTTGDPKGAMLTHINLLQTCDAVVEDKIADVNEYDIFLSFLPLSHITERSGGYYMPLRAGSCIVYSLGLLALADELQNTVRPTVLICVPRFWESLHNRYLDSLVKLDLRSRRVLEWASRIGDKCVEVRNLNKSLSLSLMVQYRIADYLALRKIRKNLTGGRLRYCISGGAPLGTGTAKFYLGIGIEMMEGYGMSEANIISLNRPGKQRVGTVGNLMPNAEISILPDGEILVRGDGRMVGYHNRIAATSESIDVDGWFHTGDIGEMSQDGYLRITDRKKDVLVLSNGKKVAPQAIEALIRQSEYISEAVLFGDNQPMVVAIIVPSTDKVRQWAVERNLPVVDLNALVSNPELVQLIKSEISFLTKNTADFEKIRDFRIIPSAFTIESGELTPTLKVKRRVVAQKYHELISTMTRKT